MKKLDSRGGETYKAGCRNVNGLCYLAHPVPQRGRSTDQLHSTPLNKVPRRDQRRQVRKTRQKKWVWCYVDGKPLRARRSHLRGGGSYRWGRNRRRGTHSAGKGGQRLFRPGRGCRSGTRKRGEKEAPAKGRDVRDRGERVTPSPACGDGGTLCPQCP